MNAYLFAVRVVILLFFLASITAYGQKNENILSEKIYLKLSNTTMLYVLTHLAYKYQIPIGLKRPPDYYKNLANLIHQSL
jgi:hypothetical protein